MYVKCIVCIKGLKKGSGISQFRVVYRASPHSVSTQCVILPAMILGKAKFCKFFGKKPVLLPTNFRLLVAIRVENKQGK